MKDRIEYVDNVRVIACFLVVLTHSVMPSVDGSDGLWMVILAILCSVNVPLFFCISGTLTLPVKTSSKSFYIKRFQRIIPPMIIWSVIGGGLDAMIDNLSISEYTHNLIMIPFLPITGVYWFLYPMIGLYLVAPFVSGWLRNATKGGIQLFLILWGITLLWPYANAIFSLDLSQGGSYFNTLNSFGGFLGYMVLGYYLHKYPIKVGFNKQFISIVIIVLLNLTYLVYLRFSGTSVSPEFSPVGYLGISCASLSVLAFTLIQHIHIKSSVIKYFISEVAKYSFGIYLIHIWIVRDLVWPIFETIYQPHVLIQAPLTAIVSLLISYCILKLISKSPYSKYIIS